MITLGSLQTSNQAQILYEENAFLQESKEALEKQLEDILSNKNENYAFSIEGQYNLSQDYIFIVCSFTTWSIS
jgi:Ni,Fe-hydrogenase I small subunit